MTTGEMINFKKKLKEHCISVIQQRVNQASMAMQQAQESANESEKSSAGDKYETSRAMGHLEKEMHARQLSANLRELSLLNSIDCTGICKQVVPGSVIKCTGTTFFIAAGIGKVMLGEEPIYCISPDAPLAALFFNRKCGEKCSFHLQDYFIEFIF